MLFSLWYQAKENYFLYKITDLFLYEESREIFQIQNGRFVFGEDVCVCGFKGKTKSVTHRNDITVPPKAA